MANTQGMQTKFTVIKNEDVEQLLSSAEIDILSILLDKIDGERRIKGKPINRYLIINTDEAYADEVIDILKQNRHWG